MSISFSKPDTSAMTFELITLFFACVGSTHMSTNLSISLEFMLKILSFIRRLRTKENTEMTTPESSSYLRSRITRRLTSAVCCARKRCWFTTAIRWLMEHYSWVPSSIRATALKWVLFTARQNFETQQKNAHIVSLSLIVSDQVRRTLMLFEFHLSRMPRWQCSRESLQMSVSFLAALAICAIWWFMEFFYLFFLRPFATKDSVLKSGMAHHCWWEQCIRLTCLQRRHVVRSVWRWIENYFLL